ncbi:MAG: Crp/Fnr family transcriptional regulator [Akkermansiaceae bacterium]|nr:Crp/Fnr family transcriptional regulator [Verrucomicrobiales bacterium]
MTSLKTTTPLPDRCTETSDLLTAAANEAENVRSPLYALIAQQPFFKGLNPQQLQLLAEQALEMQFETGQELLHEGSAANRFYLILEGQVVLETELAERGIFPIQTLGPGDDLGWSWLFPPYLLNLSARALTPTRTIFFYGTRLRERCEQDHDLGFQLMQRIAEVLIQRLHATQQRLVECIGTNKLSSLPEP